MAKLSLRIHPLFFAFGIYYALTGRIFYFLAVTITALVHELAHAARAGKLGYRLSEIVLMPYGAEIGGDIEGLKLRDEISVAFAGPALNLAIGVGVMGLWWIWPDLYAFTDLIAVVNLTLAAVNLLPAFPLDGGRIFLAALSLRVKRKKAVLIARIVTSAFAALFLAAFVWSCFRELNLSLAFFAAFLIAGAWSPAKDASYVRMRLVTTRKELTRGKRIYRFAAHESVTLKNFIAMLDVEAINEAVLVFRSGEEAELSHADIDKMLQTSDIYLTVGEIYKTLLQKSRNYDKIKLPETAD